MCGISGVWNVDGRTVDRERLTAMTRAMTHRGPDDEGFFFSNDNSLGFGFRRLSIIDLSDGHQPMSRNGKTIVFNGEIYNYRELRRECEALGAVFKTHSDTEVLLELYHRLGERCLEKLNGMFAFAVWDEARRELFLARDPLGIKPLYYFFNGKTFVFASELGALTRSGAAPLEFDPTAVMDFFAYRFVPAPYTILKNVFKVMPGQCLRVTPEKIQPTPYWYVKPDPALARESPEELERRLIELLEDSVRLQMVSDVPLGAFLSGGVDSSLIAALMCRNSKNKIQTFSIGFAQGTGVDESAHARKVAQHLGTEHHELILTEKDLMETDDVFSRMNEPVADPTVLPTAILSRFARQNVKVALTGEGGDELFAGYNRYKAVRYAGFANALPFPLRQAASWAFRRSGRGDAFRAIPDVGAHNWFSLNRDFAPETIHPLLSFNQPWDSHLCGHGSPVQKPIFGDAVNDVLDLERRTSLTDRLLMKVDMASMGQSLEARPPYLDARMVEFALNVPARWKIRRFKGKYILRKAAEKFLPKDICWRRKHGFIVPLSKWVKADSRDAVERLLGADAVRDLGILNPDAVQKAKEKIYNNGDAEQIVRLWPAIVLAGWTRSLKRHG